MARNAKQGDSGRTIPRAVRFCEFWPQIFGSSNVTKKWVKPVTYAALAAAAYLAYSSTVDKLPR